MRLSIDPQSRPLLLVTLCTVPLPTVSTMVLLGLTCFCPMTSLPKLLSSSPQLLTWLSIVAQASPMPSIACKDRHTMLTMLKVWAQWLKLIPSLPHLLILPWSHLRSSPPSHLSASWVSSRSCRPPRLPTQVLIDMTLNAYRVPVTLGRRVSSMIVTSRVCPTVVFFPCRSRCLRCPCLVGLVYLLFSACGTFL